MNNLRIVRLIQALTIDDLDILKKELKKNNNKSFIALFIALQQLKTIELSREEIYLRVYKKKWTVKSDAIFRTELSRLLEFIEDVLIQKRLQEKLKSDKNFKEEERLNIYIDLKLSKEAVQQYECLAESNSLSFFRKNIVSEVFAEYLIRSNLSLKEKMPLMEIIYENFQDNSKNIIEIQQAKSWFMKCMFNYYHKQFKNIFSEKIKIEELLKIANNYSNIEAKYMLLNGLAYMMIDSKPDEIAMKVYEDVILYATMLFESNVVFVYYKIKALHLIGTRYSILGKFEDGNGYFEQAIYLLPKEQYKNYKTVILNYATNCSKLKQFEKALSLINLLDKEMSNDYKLKAECSIRKLSCYTFMENPNAIHKLILEQDYTLLQPHEKIYFRLSQCNAYLMENEFEMANAEINNLLRSKLMQEIDADFLPATKLINYIIATSYKNGRLNFTKSQQKQYLSLKEEVKIEQFPYLKHFSPFLWLEQKLDVGVI